MSPATMHRLVVAAGVVLLLHRGAGGTGAESAASSPTIRLQPFSFPLDIGASDVEISDLDSDGHADLVVAGERWLLSLLGDGRGGFRQVWSHTPDPAWFRDWDVIVTDMDGDRTQDLVAGSSGNYLLILQGVGNGTFRTPGQIYRDAGGAPIAVADFDGDERLDVLTHVNDRTVLLVLRGQPDGTFIAGHRYSLDRLDGSYFSPRNIRQGDLDRDGAIDLVLSGYEMRGWEAAPSALMALLNGRPGFALSLYSYSRLGFALEQVNGDGYLDLLRVGAPSQVDLWLGRGDGSFRPAPAVQLGRYDCSWMGGCPFDAKGVGVGDMNGDKRPDLAIHANEVFLLALPGNGDGSFGPPVVFRAPVWRGGLYVGAFAVGELNSDDKADVIVITRGGASEGTMTVLLS